MPGLQNAITRVYILLGHLLYLSSPYNIKTSLGSILFSFVLYMSGVACQMSGETQCDIKLRNIDNNLPMARPPESAGEPLL